MKNPQILAVVSGILKAMFVLSALKDSFSMDRSALQYLMIVKPGVLQEDVQIAMMDMYFSLTELAL